jgi:hypothetical protein
VYFKFKHIYPILFFVFSNKSCKNVAICFAKSVCLLVRLSVRKNSCTTKWIFTEFHNRELWKSLSTHSSFGLNRTQIMGTVHEDLHASPRVGSNWVWNPLLPWLPWLRGESSVTTSSPRKTGNRHPANKYHWPQTRKTLLELFAKDGMRTFPNLNCYIYLTSVFDNASSSSEIILHRPSTVAGSDWGWGAGGEGSESPLCRNIRNEVWYALLQTVWGAPYIALICI